MDIVVAISEVLVKETRQGEMPEWENLSKTFKEVATYINTSEEFKDTLPKLKHKSEEYQERVNEAKLPSERLANAWVIFLSELANNPRPKFIILFYVVMVPIIDKCIDDYMEVV